MGEVRGRRWRRLLDWWSANGSRRSRSEAHPRRGVIGLDPDAGPSSLARVRWEGLGARGISDGLSGTVTLDRSESLFPDSGTLSEDLSEGLEPDALGVTEAELREFLEGDLEPTEADPLFRERLREEIWDRFERGELGSRRDH